MRIRSLILTALCLFVLVGCGDATATVAPAATTPANTSAPASTAAPATTAPAATAAATSAPATTVVPMTTAPAATGAANMTHIVVSMGFIPSVQYAPYYIAVDKGYYSAEGLDVELNHDRVQEQLQLLASGKFDFAVTSGDTLIQARVHAIPTTYVMRQFTKYPVGALAIADPAKPLKTPADLKGRNVGISGPGSTTFIALKALEKAANLTDVDLKITNVGFTEIEALTQKRVDVAMTYLPNEPVAMQANGTKIETITVSPYVDLVSTGLAVSDQTAKTKADIVQRFVRATVKGMQATLANPDDAFTSALKRMPETTGDQIRIERLKLTAALEYSQPVAGHPLGWIDPAGWKTTEDFLQSVKLIDNTPDPATMFTNQFVEAKS